MRNDIQDEAEQYALFQRFAPIMLALPSGELTKERLLHPDLELGRDDKLAMYYAPFDYVNSAAKVILLGITPGFTQMAIALQWARIGLLSGKPVGDICQEAKFKASFAGQMRKNLVDMLDGIELHKHLSIPSCAALFETHRGLAHTTSAIRYPVFYNEVDYSGSQRKIKRSPMPTRYVETILAEELDAVPNALVVPLGKAATEALEMLVTSSRLDPARCLLGFPHPSGQNGSRTTRFEENRDALRATLAAWFTRQSIPVGSHAASDADDAL